MKDLGNQWKKYGKGPKLDMIKFRRRLTLLRVKTTKKTRKVKMS